MATVPATPRTNRITVGAPSAGPFLVGFRLFSAAIEVYVDGQKRTDWTLTANFAAGYDDDASITFLAPLATAAEIQIDSCEIPEREEDYANPDPGLTRKLNAELARITAALADLHMKVGRSIRALSDIDPDDGVTATDLANLSQYADEAEQARDEVLAIQQLIPRRAGPHTPGVAYVFGDLVQRLGSTYFCLIPHTAGTFTTDLGLGRWEGWALKGDAGVGIGDVVAANAGSEYSAAASAFRANLGLSIGTNVQAFNQLLGAVSGLGANGIIARLSGSTAAARTMTGSAGITVTNGDGVSGNPTFALAFASQAEAEAGTETTKPVTSQRVAQAITARADKGRVLITAASLTNSASYEFKNLTDGTFQSYELELRGLVPSTDAAQLLIRTSPDLGSTPVFSAGASDYEYANILLSAGASVTPVSSSGNTAMQLTGNVGNVGTEEGVTGKVTWFDRPSRRPRFTWALNYDNTSSVIVTSTGAGSRKDTASIYAIVVFYSTGLMSGTLRLYGIRA